MISLLVVGCEANMLHLLGDVLTEAGFMVTSVHADDAIEDGLELVDPMVIVCDEVDGVFNGEQLFGDLKRTARWAGIPFILLSDQCNAERVARSLDAGMEDFISKPFAIEEFHARIRKAVRHRMRNMLHVGEDVGFTGKLEFLELPDLIINLHQNQRTGELGVSDADGDYRFVFSAGEFVSAQGPGGIAGRKAVFRGIRNATGLFTFVPREHTDDVPQSELTSPTNLVLSAMQESDEFPLTRGLLPDGLVGLSASTKLKAASAPIVVLPLLEGAKAMSINALIDACPRTDLESVTELHELFKKEVLVAHDTKRSQPA